MSFVQKVLKLGKKEIPTLKISDKQKIINECGLLVRNCSNRELLKRAFKIDGVFEGLLFSEWKIWFHDEEALIGSFNFPDLSHSNLDIDTCAKFKKYVEKAVKTINDHEVKKHERKISLQKISFNECMDKYLND